jgi:hypothetical protein
MSPIPLFASGKRVFFVSNNASKVALCEQKSSINRHTCPSIAHFVEADALQARADFVVKLTKMQFPALPNDVFSSAFAAAMSEAPTSLCTIKTSPRSIVYEINTTNTFLINL